MSATKDSYTLKVDRHSITITNPDRILFPKDKLTKLDLINYYDEIAPIMIPLMHGRPVSMQRFPEGINHEGFYQKDAGDYFPTWIKRQQMETEEGNKIVHYVVCNNAATLVYLAQQAVITPHLWLSTTKKLNYPDRLIFDFDPPSEHDFADVMRAAKAMRNLLEERGLVPHVMTTGSRGVHVTTPIKPQHTFDVVRATARALAQELVQQYPDLVTTNVRKDAREGKVFVDYLRNAWGQTGVAPYAVRAREGAPIATPLHWDELTARMQSQKFTMKNIFKRLARMDDPWKDMHKSARSLKV